MSDVRDFLRYWSKNANYWSTLYHYCKSRIEDMIWMTQWLLKSAQKCRIGIHNVIFRIFPTFSRF